MKKILFIIPLLLFSSLLQAQEVAISYEINPQTDQQATMQLYLQSLTDQDQAIKAINFSLALPEGCVKVKSQEAIFQDIWTDYLQEIQMEDQLDLTYNNWHYTHRWQYGSADPGLPATAPVIAPAQGNEPLMFMQIQLEGSCIDEVYLEQQAENPINQMGDADVLPIEWTVIHPKTALELGEDLSLNVYPNPVEDFLQLEWKGPRETSYQLQLQSMDGKIIWTKAWEKDEENRKRILLTELASAAYILQVSSDDGHSPQNIKILKK